MQVFLTGATGFIGGHLCRRLIAAGHQVRALVRDPKKATSLPSGVEKLEGDLTIFDRPELELAPSDVVIHMAAVVTAKSQDQYKAINFRAVRSFVDCVGRQK